MNEQMMLARVTLVKLIPLNKLARALIKLEFVLRVIGSNVSVQLNYSSKYHSSLISTEKTECYINSSRFLLSDVQRHFQSMK